MKKEETIQLVNNMKNRKLNADTMRFKDMSSTMNPNMMCEIVWTLGYNLMNEKFLGNFSKMKKTKLDKRITKKGKKVEYLIKWDGYGPKDNTWEPICNIYCPVMLRTFEEKLKKEKIEVEKAKVIYLRNIDNLSNDLTPV